MNKNLMKAYEIDASRLKGKAKDVLVPSTIGEVMKVVAINKRIVPRGSGTGLAGGAVPQNGQDVIVDLSKLIRIDNFDKDRMTVEVEAGVILDELQYFVGKFGLEFPVNPSSHSVVSVGGMIATDAVGSRAIKYGKTSNWVKWIEVVDDNGNLQRKGATELSDYAGMEGTTGIIVKACLKLSPKKDRRASLIKVDNIDEIIPIVRKFKTNSSVSMIEFLDKGISEGVGLPFAYHLIVEYEKPNNMSWGEEDSSLLSGEEYHSLLTLRDGIYPFVAGEGYIRIEDPKILIDRFDKLMYWLEKNKIPTFGHLSVGILHPCFNHDQEKLIPEMMTLVKRLGGQVSGEHGIGLLKRGFVEINDQKILRNVKKRTDPMNKFNVGKVI
jgi:glycolate oxidase